MYIPNTSRFKEEHLPRKVAMRAKSDTHGHYLSSILTIYSFFSFPFFSLPFPPTPFLFFLSQYLVIRFMECHYIRAGLC